MGSMLRVNPAVLRSAADKVGQVGTELSGLGLGQSFTGAVTGLAGSQSGAACQDAGSVIDNACQRLSDRFSKLSKNLQSAADKYERTDEQLGRRLDKARDKIDGKDGFKDLPKDPPPGPNSGSTGGHSVPIPLDQVTYGHGNFATGPAATREYINQALDKLGITDPAARQRWTNGYMTMAQRESTYNPNSVNDWDINSKPPNSTYNVSDGYGNGCSRGVVQCVPGTFAQYHQPGTSNNIYDPVANIAASMNYAMEHYGVSKDGSNLAARIPQANPGASPRGY
jgi:uncharacterized protein YukE